MTRRNVIFDVRFLVQVSHLLCEAFLGAFWSDLEDLGSLYAWRYDEVINKLLDAISAGNPFERNGSKHSGYATIWFIT